ncbi:MAG TPA: gamma-glutamyltransferase family protein [Limnochordia bacterium]|nr:gamma-glutamyltransferase family protein [Limnochordia bacterium]
MDPLAYPYPSRRMSVYARRGMVAASQPLAAAAGLERLRRGGNAVDAAVAAAIALTVVEPTANGIGGDAFAIVHAGGKLHGLNASGPAPAALSAEALRKQGHAEVPRFGFAPVTVPGAPAAWAALNRRFGRLPFADLCAPAMHYAADGYPISPVLGDAWARAEAAYRRALRGEAFAHWFATFAPEGRAPAIGELWRSPAHADTLAQIAATGGEAFYRGELAKRMDAFSRAHGGFLRARDLAEFEVEWVEPIRVAYRGYEVCELPPNGHGLVALIALGILDGLDLAPDEPRRTHQLIEAVKLAFADGRRYIADPRRAPVPAAELLAPAYLAERRALIGERALEPAPGRPQAGGTVYLAAADGEGNMVSYIQSNYQGFGSGLVVPGTGIALHNRGCNFTLEPDHPNVLAPCKRPYHTIIPGFLQRDGRPIGPFGVMGGFMQPQGHVQVLSRLLDEGRNPQAALDAPRWQWLSGRAVEFEVGTPAHVVHGLERLGHEVRWAVGSYSFGRGQVIWRLDNGALVGGTEPRTDAQIAAF